MSFNEDLDILSNIIVKSRSKKLKKAYRNFLLSLNISMKDYVSYMKLLEGLGNSMKVPDKWDVSLVGKT